MSLNSPAAMLLAWVVAPLLIFLICAGLGTLIERASGRRLGVLALPVGFTVGLILMPALLQAGLSADFTSAVVVVSGAAGLILRWLRPLENQRGPLALLRRPGSQFAWAIGCAAAVYLILMLPLILTGRIGVLGYFLLNDPAWHTALIEWLHQHGHVTLANPTSSYETVSSQIDYGYPLGTHVWPLLAIGLTGQSAFALWTPISAIAPALLAIVIFSFTRSLGLAAKWAGIVAVVATLGYLPMQYYAQGGSKEVLFAFTFVLSAWLLSRAAPLPGESWMRGLRGALPAALSCAAAAYVFGPAAALWVVPLVGMALVIALASPPAGVSRATLLKAASAAVAVLLLLMLPAIVKALSILDGVTATAEAAGEVGNLKGPVPLAEVFNAWLSHDYRDPAPLGALAGPSWLLTLVAAALALAGLWAASRARRPFLFLAVLPALFAAVWTTALYNDYFAAKSYVVLAGALACATLAGLVWLLARRRRIALICGGALAAAVALNFAMVLGGSIVTPDERFEELAAINERFAGSGPMLVAEREEYAIGLLRDAGGWNTYGLIKPGIPLRQDGLPSMMVPPDTDGYVTVFFSQAKTAITRNGPAGSRLPAAFEPVYRTRHYTVWQRTGTPPLIHVPIGLQTDSGSAELQCDNPEFVEAMRQARAGDRKVLVATRTPESTIVPIGPGGGEGFVEINNLKSVDVPTAELRDGQRYALYIQGTFAAGTDVTLPGGESLRLVGDFASRENWKPAGSFTADGSPVTLERATGWWHRVGGARSDAVRLAAFVPEDQTWEIDETDASGAEQHCGRTVDWVEVVPR